MRTDVDQRVQALRAQPQIEGDIAMTRNARQVVVIAIACRDMAALGL